MSPVADVYQGDRLVAHFERIDTGVRLAFLDSVALSVGRLATTLAGSNTESTDLPNFFLNLLPEGARLQLLLQAARSKEDSLGLLLKVGWDTIGDVAVLPHGEEPPSHGPLLQRDSEKKIRFWDLFYGGNADPADHAIPGVQEKISGATMAFGVRSSKVPTGILKLNPPRFPRLVQNEEFFLRMAKACGLHVNQAKLISDAHGEPGLLVTRFDRVKRGGKTVKLHVEDGCQLLNAPPGAKYHLSMRTIADRIASVCSSPIIEIDRLARLIAFSYVVGNGDLHAKNISVLWDGMVALSPAYDLISTLPYPALEQRMALKLDGKDDNFRCRDFVEFCLRYGVPASATTRTVHDVCDRAESWIDRFEEIGFDEKITESLKKEVRDRIRRLRR